MYEDNEEEMYCGECGVSANNPDTGIWDTEWDKGGSVFVGMICGDCRK